MVMEQMRQSTQVPKACYIHIPCECGRAGRTYELRIYLESVRGWVAARGILSLSIDITFSSTSLPINTHISHRSNMIHCIYIVYIQTHLQTCMCQLWYCVLNSWLNSKYVQAYSKDVFTYMGWVVMVVHSPSCGLVHMCTNVSIICSTVL